MVRQRQLNIWASFSIELEKIISASNSSRNHYFIDLVDLVPFKGVEVLFKNESNKSFPVQLALPLVSQNSTLINLIDRRHIKERRVVVT